MARWLRQSTSVDLPIGPFLDSTDGVTAETALTLTQPDIRLKKNAGNWAQKAAAQTLSHEENGNYEVTLDATDTNTLGLLRLHVAESGALPVWDDFLVVPANVWDSFFASDLLQVDATQFAGQTITAAAGVTLPASVASPTNITAGTITTVTNLTNAPTAGDLTATMKTSVTTAATAATPTAAAVTGNVGGNVTGSVGSLGATAKSDVNAEVVDALATDTYAEPAQGAPGATTTLAAKINYLYKAFRNKKTQTSTTWSLFADDATTVDHKSTVSDDGTTATRGEIATGP